MCAAVCAQIEGWLEGPLVSVFVSIGQKTRGRSAEDTRMDRVIYTTITLLCVLII
jgi:hypothetical protein